MSIPSSAGRPALEARWFDEGARAAVVAPPHPLYGGTMDNPVVHALVSALRQASVSVLAFNWRGVGRSEGTPTGSEAAAAQDYRAALDHLARLRSAPFVAAGYSFGAVAALRATLAGAPVDELLLVSPPTAMIGARPLDRIAARTVFVAGSDDPFVDPVDLEQRAAAMPRAEVRLVRGADHFFAGSIGALAEQLGQSPAD